MITKITSLYENILAVRHNSQASSKDISIATIVIGPAEAITSFGPVVVKDGMSKWAKFVINDMKALMNKYPITFRDTFPLDSFEQTKLGVMFALIDTFYSRKEFLDFLNTYLKSRE